MNQKKSWIKRIISFIVILTFILFSWWFIKQESSEFFPTVFSILAVILFCSTLNKLSEPLEILFCLDKDSYIKTFIPVFDDKKNIITIVLFSFVWLLIIDIIIVITLKYYYPLNSLGSALDTHFSFFLSTKKYIFIAKNWYQNISTDYASYFFIFPLYPILLKILNIFNNYILTGIIISNIFAVASGVVLYKIALFDFNESESLRVVKFYFIFPSMFFLVLPLADSTLIFFSLLYVFFIRKREWLLSFLIGLFAGLTSPLALPLVSFAIFEFISMARETYLDKKYYGIIDLNNEALQLITYKDTIEDILPLALKGLSILSIPTSVFFYFVINKDMYLNPVKIILYFKGLFSKQYNYFFSTTFVYIFNILSNDKSTDLYILGVYIPNFLILCIILVIMYFGGNKIRSSYFIYSIIYFLSIFALQNPLSSPRLSLLLFPVYFMLAKISENYILNIFLTFTSVCMLLVYLLLFLLNYPVF